jgi:hypothetical protein
MDRMNNFIIMLDHPMNCKLIKKLSAKELQMVKDFIDANQHLPSDEYMKRCNRWMIDDKNKPKNHTTMWAIASQCV